jgi:hypothetical protein
METGIQSPLVDDVVVIVVMKNGDRIQSPLMPGVIASDQKLGIELHRDRAANHRRWEVPRWLPAHFDFSQVAEVDTHYRGTASAAGRT